MEVPCGSGKQHMRWLALAVATRMQKERYPHAFRVPQRIVNSEGVPLRPRSVIHDVLEDGEEVTVELRQGAAIPEEDFEAREWQEEAYGPQSNLMECKFRWKIDSRAPAGDIPKLVRGDFEVAPRWQNVYPQKDYGGKFEIRVEPVETGPDNTLDWVASRKGPPGRCNYIFVMKDDTSGEGGSESICKANPETLTPRGTQHQCEFKWDVPIADEPYPEVDSRPSTASSRDGAQADPRFEQDWESMRLKWVESFMKVRVKDVLTEFYAILIDLFDSYAFMGMDLSANQHTIGMDDWKHLVINCGLLEGQPEGELSWKEVCGWYEEAAGVRDGRPYLAQRLTRAHYLELLMRTAGWSMCEHPRPQYRPEAGRPPMPLDEGLFRFITDILIPVMDTYDEDPIRKDAVQQQNLIVIQQSRPSIRSIYAFLAQPWPPYDKEKVVVPATAKYVFEYVLEKLRESENGGAAAGGEGGEGEATGPDFAALLGGDQRLTEEQLGVVVGRFDEAVSKVTENHPEPPEQCALLFWEFFEVLMQCCRELAVSQTLPDGIATLARPLHETIPAFVQTALAFMGLVDIGETTLPDPPFGEDEETMEGSTAGGPEEE